MGRDVPGLAGARRCVGGGVAPHGWACAPSPPCLPASPNRFLFSGRIPVRIQMINSKYRISRL
ncbi:hypothetical protein SAM23877_4887 [Streptomyces ambofaciens ATCC 23877]|uniref:Uncharacterized protein n=1 Tax=Streptomyces ambofaciens (strain ATCC 23877 / 3486 / DSM 40053 / JCM 4204 / NBRC 12836 / NRRL B-2516) TaxID=278992 RepID=A0A0K2AYM2_STRA7|nr:hypothetical protein SAM23877_4887 [Streptomyces ambofaciens ATCC 23877]